MTILELAESFETMNRPDPESIKNMDVQFGHNLYSSLQFVLSKFWIDIFDNLETICFSAT